MFRRLTLLPVLMALFVSPAEADTPPAKPKPEYQYRSGDIAIPAATADEPKVTAFGPDSVRAASRYLEDGALSWVREKSCVNCHTTGPYLSERPALSPLLGPPNAEILADFAESIPEGPAKEAEKNGHRYVSGSWTAIWCALGLAEWDRHVTGKTSADTDRALRQMMSRQSPNGAFVSYGEVEIPHITTDFELSLQAVRALTAAPGWLDSLEAGETRDRIERLKAWMKSAAPKNDFDRVLRLQLAHYLPDLVSPAEKESALALLASKQQDDGGWSTRDFSAVQDWHYEMSDAVVKLLASLPDAADPQSDAYMTALAVVMMRQNGIPTTDPRIQRALTWLKGEQRVSGRWWMHSLYRGNYHYTTYIATAQALKALALCDELPKVAAPAGAE
ncbi:MAG: terpene cyclase/mutase family protein [Verrucomicrobiales bacterium]|nr:terpene cyclase/mutase family protein [Verrucomicrobiales bacterium]